jgi:hypothetical protein
MEVVFSQPLGLWRFCFSESFLDFGVCVGFCCCCFLWQEVHLEVSGGVILLSSCRWLRVLAGLQLVLANFDARSTLILRLLRDTRHSYGSIGVFWFCRWMHQSCGFSVTGVWLSRPREVFYSRSAWRSRSASFCCAKVVPGHREVDLLFGSFGGGACRTRPRIRRWQCSTAYLGWFFC